VDRFNRDSLERGMNRKGMEITDEARASFAIAFGIAPELQKAMEDKYSTYTIDPYRVKLSSWKALQARDPHVNWAIHSVPVNVGIRKYLSYK